MTNYDILKEYEAHKTPVPSYDEYISLVNWKEDLTELCTVKERIIEKYENIDTWWKAECAELKEENAQLKERVSKLEKMQYSYTPEEWNTMLRTVNRTSEQNAHLKELLSECLAHLTLGEEGASVTPLNIVIDNIKEVLK